MKDKSIFKMTPEELQVWLQCQRRTSRLNNKKGKGSYKRKSKYQEDI